MKRSDSWGETHNYGEWCIMVAGVVPKGWVNAESAHDKRKRKAAKRLRDSALTELGHVITKLSIKWLNLSPGEHGSKHGRAGAISAFCAVRRGDIILEEADLAPNNLLGRLEINVD